jgi:hypothetical protein
VFCKCSSPVCLCSRIWQPCSLCPRVLLPYVFVPLLGSRFFRFTSCTSFSFFRLERLRCSQCDMAIDVSEGLPCMRSASQIYTFIRPTGFTKRFVVLLYFLEMFLNLNLHTSGGVAAEMRSRWDVTFNVSQMFHSMHYSSVTVI